MPEQPRKVIDDKQLKKLLADSKPSFLDKNRHQIVTLVLMAISIAVYLVEVVLSGFSASISVNVLYSMGAMYAPAIQSAADLYRFVTPMFLHLDIMHIAFNMVALYSVGGLLERVLGKGNFLLLYFIGGITGNAASYVYDVFFTGVATISAGASTSVFGLFVAVALLGVLHKGNRNYFMQISKGVLGIIVVNIAYTFLVPGISISGHLGGALGGLIAMFMLPAKELRVPTVVRILVALAWLAALGYLFYTCGLF
ncbi:MAG: rhomboid family intramembrane serine protease [Raoultibacter sp.]|jgi:rhomboid protease GluP